MVTKMCNAKHKFERLALTKEELLEMFSYNPFKTAIIQSKVPDGGMQPRLASLDFRFQKGYSKQLPDAYQPLLLDAINGDASLFARSDEVELAWQIVDPILNAWQTGQAPPLELYEPGEWGPATSHQWMQQFQREWFDVCPVIH